MWTLDTPSQGPAHAGYRLPTTISTVSRAEVTDRGVEGESDAGDRDESER